MTGARFELAQVVKRGEETLFSALVTVAIIDKAGRPKRIRPALAETLSR